MVLLREQILGPERFDWAFRKYIRDWAFKHPSPSDFFRAMESEGGEDLSYFWRGWFMNNWTMDMAVKDAQYVKRRLSPGRQRDHREPRAIGAAVLGAGEFRRRQQHTREPAGRDLAHQAGTYTFTLSSKQPSSRLCLIRTT